MIVYGVSTWRAQAAPIIAKVLEDNYGKSNDEIRTALRDAYPFGERKYHPYKIWLNEIQRQWKQGRRVRVITDMRTAFLGPRV